MTLWFSQHPNSKKGTWVPRGSQGRWDSEKKVWFRCAANKRITWKYLMKTTDLLIAAGLAQWDHRHLQWIEPHIAGWQQFPMARPAHLGHHGQAKLPSMAWHRAAGSPAASPPCVSRAPCMPSLCPAWQAPWLVTCLDPPPPSSSHKEPNTKKTANKPRLVSLP